MSYAYARRAADVFSARMKALGFRAFLSYDRTYGFVTDDQGTRVMCFGFMSGGGRLSGQYSPPSRESGTGWELAQKPDNLKTAADVRDALYATPPPFAGKGWKRLSTLDDYLEQYQASSKFTEV